MSTSVDGVAALSDFAAFSKLKTPQRKAIATELAAQLGDDFRAGKELAGDAELPVLVHVPSKLELVVVPGGRFTMGYTPEDEAAVERWLPEKEFRGLRKRLKKTVSVMKPPRTVKVAPFALARRPLREDAELRLLFGEAHGESFQREDAEALVARWGFRFPSEAELEYVMREGRQLTFALDVAAAHFDDAEPRDETAWGIASPASCVWAADRWHRDYAHAPENSAPWVEGKGHFMYRGAFTGGLDVMQSEDELIFALTSLRVAPLGEKDDNDVGLRLALGPDAEGRWRAPRTEAKRVKKEAPVAAVTTKPGSVEPRADDTSKFVTPSGALTRVITWTRKGTTHTGPFWRAAEDLASEQIARSESWQAVKAALSPAEVVRACLELNLVGAYGPSLAMEWPLIVAAGAENCAWAEAWLSVDPFPRPPHQVMLYALLYPLAVAGKRVDPRWAGELELVAPQESIAVWNAVPEASREGAMLVALERTLRESSRLNDTLFFVKRYPRPALALACLAYFTSKDGAKKHGKPTMRSWVSLLRKLCVEQPTLQETLTQFPPA